jgi:hypothetical protein
MNWISVKDQLPKSNSFVLIISKNKTWFAFFRCPECNFILWEILNSSGITTFGDAPSRDSVTHWMPLPKPPETNDTTT